LLTRRAAASIDGPLLNEILKKPHATELIRRLGANESLFWGGVGVFDETMKSGLLSPAMRTAHHERSTYDVVRQYQEVFAANGVRSDYCAGMTYLELKLRLPELLLMRVDKITMATSIEARVPFLDHHLIEYAMALPQMFKVKNGSGKHILKKALESVLPNDVLYQRKRGFGAPTGEWFRGPDGERLVQQITDSTIHQRNFFDVSVIRRMADEHRRGEKEWGTHLWCLLNLGIWYDRWIGGSQNS